ncbi:MAG: CoB--CoM heterodisulfide reductase iron-sulfur subunit A family protein, partial [Opitutae bacterium]|nr:CoB--CoM heterodisulfide reductase iron-sulfur subunit A family protein [Opitutae bacterium]
VIGGGIAGMAAAQALAAQGYTTHLVEREAKLGGQARHLFQTPDGRPVAAQLDRLIDDVTGNANIRLHLDSELTVVEGFVGNFKTTVKNEAGETPIEHGVAIIATGAKPLVPTEYSYGQDPRILTSLELDAKFKADDPALKTLGAAVFIQCVGSREPERPYCSRVCCTHSIDSALAIKARNPEANVYILYRDIRTYGQRERIYNQAREMGIIFINYEEHGPPEVSREGEGVLVRVWDHVLHRPLEIPADMVILASATLASPDMGELASLFRLPLSADGFFQEAHAKLRPVEFHVDGVFVAGLAHYPKPLEESISQALAAAARAGRLLARGEIALEAHTALV